MTAQSRTALLQRCAITTPECTCKDKQWGSPLGPLGVHPSGPCMHTCSSWDRKEICSHQGSTGWGRYILWHDGGYDHHTFRFQKHLAKLVGKKDKYQRIYSPYSPIQTFIILAPLVLMLTVTYQSWVDTLYGCNFNLWHLCDLDVMCAPLPIRDSGGECAVSQSDKSIRDGKWLHIIFSLFSCSKNPSDILQYSCSQNIN